MGARAADHPASPHAGIWREINRDCFAEVLKVKAHLSKEQAEATGYAAHWQGNLFVDRLAKETAKGYGVTEAQRDDFDRHDVHEARMLRSAAVLLADWPVPMPKTRQLVRARRGSATPAAGGRRHQYEWLQSLRLAQGTEQQPH